MSKDGYNIKICDLKNVAVKGKVTSVRQSKTNVFTVDSIDTLFPMYFEIGYDELHEITNGEIQTLPKVGDSIIKEAKSKFIKFKRGNKIFIAELYLKNCD